MKRRTQSGQVLVDYLLTLALTVTIVTLLAQGFRTGLRALWQTIAQEVSAACPGCPPDSTIRLSR